MKLLVVDDDAALIKTMMKLLTRQNYLVDVAIDGQVAWERIQSQTYDLIVLDVMLPKLDGVSLCQKLRQEGYATPILLLTARNSSTDKVAGLDAGADDYVIKPFDYQELLARIRALLRRKRTVAPEILTWGLLSLNPTNCEVHYAGTALMLRPKEYKLLELLLQNPNRVFSCGAILEHLWSFEDLPSEDTVRAHVKGLRQKLRAVAITEIIETVYGLGYRLKPVAPQPSQPTIAQQATVARPVSELRQAIAAAWEEVKPEMSERVVLLQTVVDAIKTGTVEPQLRQRAIATAHNLAGIVGSYGFERSSQLARQIEALLKSDRLFDPDQARALRSQVTALRQDLSFSAASSPLPMVIPADSHPAQAADAARILAVDDDLQILQLLKQVLEPWGLNLTVLLDAKQLWHYLENTTPDLLLLDVVMPHQSGLALCERVRSTPRWAGLPIVFLTAHTDAETVQRVFMAGADDFVSKPIVDAELVNRVVSRIERHRFWQRLMEQDRLTQVANRIKFTQEFERLLQKAEHHHQPMALILLKVDQLKSINLKYGYHSGDAVLSSVGQRLRQVGTEHLMGRWSGGKFAIAVYGSTANEALQQLSDLILELGESELMTPDGLQVVFTVSTGVAAYPENGRSAESLYRWAEAALGD